VEKEQASPVRYRNRLQVIFAKEFAAKAFPKVVLLNLKKILICIKVNALWISAFHLKKQLKL
jgi:septum formation topological specificity factor MinE